MTQTEVDVDLKCFHCGQSCDDPQWTEEKPFCCYGCKTVYEILSSNNLCEYYDLEKTPGIQLKHISEETYAYLDDKDVRAKLLDFDSDAFAKVTFFIPSIHCVSCIWLLENLQKMNDGILHSEVVFTQKTVSINFNPQKTKISAIVKLIAGLGYVPKITLATNANVIPKKDNSLILKISLAGFCFGNIMLFSFPEYLGIDRSEEELMVLFSWLNLCFSVPVFFYSGFDYLQSAFKSFKQRQINIDVPIAAGLIALFVRSSYDIITSTGPGYFDSFTGLVFFLLIGRWFQNKTYESLAFDRDFTSYFPLAVNVLVNDEWQPVVIYKLKRGDQIKIRNMEIIPADSIFLNDLAYIDYSFVTGESRPVKVKQGDVIYAGGRLIGSPIELMVEKKTSQSHLTSLWNNDAFKKGNENKYQRIIDLTAKRFTWVVLIIAGATGIYWQVTQPEKMWLVLTSVLMVACPCALALTTPFTFGSMLRVFGRNKLYLKNTDVIERMASIDTIVFDKTGTITHGKEPEIKFEGTLDEFEMSAVKILTSYSAHPLSLLITQHVKSSINYIVTDFREIPGKGIEGTIDGSIYKIGSATFVGINDTIATNSARVFISIDDNVKGYFTIKSSTRANIAAMISRLGTKCAALLSGDNEADKVHMQKLFGTAVELLFNQSPQDKLNYIKQLQAQGKKVMMLGDGLNDAGALKQSDVGIAVTDDTGVFTPACDGILAGENISSLDKVLLLAKSSTTILKIGFAISFLYNAITLSIAVSGHLTPLVAAILMPISSMSVVGFSVLAVNISSKIKLSPNPTS
jgi:Cu+-exporting ATPase